MKLRLMTAAVAGACAMIALPAMAEEAYQGSWYVLPTIGVMRTDSDLKADNHNLNYGLRLGKEINENWDVQVELNHAKADEDSSHYQNGRYRQTLLGVDALYFFSRDKFRPFLMAGVGAAYNTMNYNGNAPTPDANGHNYSLMANVGLGAQYLFTDNIGLQADLRQVFSRAKANGGIFGNDNRETVANTYLNLGLVIRFGGPTQVAAAEPMPEAAPYVVPVEAAKPEPEKMPEPIVVAPAPKPFTKMTIQEEVLFDFDHSTVKEAGKKTLSEQVVVPMTENPQVDLFLITGHADRLGSDKYNQKLSEQRANSVKAYLVSQGIEANRLHAVGKGESEPTVKCDEKNRKKLIQCLQPNRRVELEIETQTAVQK